MQQLQVNLTIPVPEGYVMVKKVELEELKHESLSGICWTMTELEQRIKKKRNWIKEYVLFPSKFREILDTENGGFVYYPKGIGEHWSFHAIQMANFIDENYSLIFGYESK
ncbi:DUF771 domain-containing protein [Lysinibacillus sp. FSL R7-0073]|uniref:DUF771 domain-containing protein n=1 Tax=Lysinibacillus sp. FSL R7-0073 TaxID=2921669 RepID=UPI0030FC2AE4